MLVAAGQTIIVSPSASNNCGISRLPAGFIHHPPPPQWRPFPAHPVACVLCCAIGASPRGAPSPSSTYNRKKRLLGGATGAIARERQTEVPFKEAKSYCIIACFALPYPSALLLLREKEGNILSCPTLSVCCHWLRIEIPLRF